MYKYYVHSKAKININSNFSIVTLNKNHNTEVSEP